MVKKSNIAYLGINSSYSHSMLAYGKLRAWCEAKGVTASWHEFSRTVKDFENGLLSEILEVQPCVVIATCYLFNIEAVIKALGMMKAVSPEIITVVGGPEFLGDNERFLRTNHFIDYCMRGDESSFEKVIKFVCKGNIQKKQIEGLCYLDESNNYIDNRCALFSGNADELPSLYSMNLFPKK